MKFRNLILAALLGMVTLSLACTPPSWAVEAENIAKVSLPIVESIAVMVGAGPAVPQVINDINLLITLFDRYQATPAAGILAQIQAGLAAANADIAQILPAAHIQDVSTQNKVAAILLLVQQEFAALASVIPSAQPVAVGAEKAAKVQLPFSAKDFKKQYNRIIQGDGRFKPLK